MVAGVITETTESAAKLVEGMVISGDIENVIDLNQNMGDVNVLDRSHQEGNAIEQNVQVITCQNFLSQLRAYWFKFYFAIKKTYTLRSTKFQKKAVDCEWNEWKETTKCSKLCGGGDKTGTKMFTRDKKVPEKAGGECSNVFSRFESCTSDNVCSGNLISYSYLEGKWKIL